MEVLKRSFLVVLLIGTCLCQLIRSEQDIRSKKKKIAIIGGGISGTFVTKYLTDYDTNCQIDSITIFDPSTPWKGPKEAASYPPDDDWQGSRVESLRLMDGSVVEMGASIGYKDFYLVLDMIRNDPTLKIGAPFSTNQDETVDPNMRQGLAVYNGDREVVLSTVNKTAWASRMSFMWRYGFDAYNVARVCKQALYKFAKVAVLLNDTKAGTFFESPDEIWNRTGLFNLVHSSFDDLLETMGVYSELPFWRSWLPMQGSFRDEFLTAINLVNYNQDTSQINALVGLGSFAATSGGIFSVLGGNAQLLTSALKQAETASAEHCSHSNQILLESQRVTTVVGSHESLELFSDQEELGMFDIVILAAPLQQARINFLIKSVMDEVVLQEMPLGKLINPERQRTEDGHSILASGLPPAAKRPYTQVVTTIIRNGTVSAEEFGIPEASLPRSISFTSKGKAEKYNITVITQLSASAGLFKVFSNNKLDNSVLTKIFGPHHTVEYVKFWGGPHGGATPDYQGDGQAPGFVLWDGAKGIEGYSTSGALYYPSAMEQSTLASMELCAIGAKAVAKLVARRLGLVKVVEAEEEAHDEL